MTNTDPTILRDGRAVFASAQHLPHACNCIGPQNGQPRCPCAMRDVRVVDGRYVLPAQDLGPVTAQPAAKSALDHMHDRCAADVKRAFAGYAAAPDPAA